MLDDHFVSSAANEISSAQMEQREKQKAVQGVLNWTLSPRGCYKFSQVDNLRCQTVVP